MNVNMEKYIWTCPHCQAELNDWFIGNFQGKYFNKKLDTLRRRYFCTKECYEDYKSQYIVEIYNDQPIYCIEIGGEKRYMERPAQDEFARFFAELNGGKNNG